MITVSDLFYKIARVDGFDMRSLFEHRTKLNEGAKTHIDSYKAQRVWLSGRIVFRQKEQQVQRLRQSGDQWGWRRG